MRLATSTVRKPKPLPAGSEWSFESIDRYNSEIARVAADYGLDTYPVQIEIIIAEQMMDAYASVGMPVPEWVRTGLPFFAEYQRKVAPILEEVARSRTIRFVDLYGAPVPMWDATHPDPARTRSWAQALAVALRAEAEPAPGAGRAR